MSKVISFHTQIPQSVQDTINQYGAKQATCASGGRNTHPVKVSVAPSVVIQMETTVLRGWELYSNELEFE